MRLSDLTIHEGLSMVKLDGFKAEPEYVTDEYGGQHRVDEIDPLGSANWLCEQYGMSPEDFTAPGILYHDYDGWRGGSSDFTLLIAEDEAEALATFAREAGYDVEAIEPVTEPIRFGDGGGTVEILRHRDGWVILEG